MQVDLSLDEGPGDDAREPEKPAGPSAQELKKRLGILQTDQESLLATNERLQRAIRSVLDLRRRGAAEDDSKLGTAEARYKSLSASLEEQKSKLASSAAKYDRTVEELREELHERLTRTTQIQNVRLCLSLSFFVAAKNVTDQPATTAQPDLLKLQFLR